MVKGVCGSSGEGFDGMNVIGNKSHDDGGLRGQFGGYRHGFRHGGEFSGELWFDAI
jgi:hypothetical protein